LDLQNFKPSHVAHYPNSTRMVKIFNEYSPLKSVILHRPGREINGLTPTNMTSYLFEDIPYLARMQNEHDLFSKILTESGIEVLYVKDLVREIVQDGNNFNRILSKVCAENQQYGMINSLTNRSLFKIDDIVDIIFEGLTAYDFQEISGDTITSIDNDYYLINPLPNSYFTRDPAAIIGNNALSG
jgi:arginine deiminase